MWNRAEHFGEKGSMTTIFFDDEEKKAITVKGICAKRNNNPGNIEYGNFTKTFGAIGRAGKDNRFAVFATEEEGFNCMKKLLCNSKHYKDKTIEEIVNKYAPSIENNVEDYIKAIEEYSGLGRKFVPKFEVDYLKLCKAMARHEGFYNEKVIIKDVEYNPK